MSNFTPSYDTNRGEKDDKSEEKMQKSLPAELENQGLGDYYHVAEKILFGLIKLINKVNPNVSIITSEKGNCALYQNYVHERDTTARVGGHHDSEKIIESQDNSSLDINLSTHSNETGENSEKYSCISSELTMLPSNPRI